MTVNADAAFLYLVVDGVSYRIRWEDCSRRLRSATAAEREVSPAGYGIHWPLIDEDLAVDPLLKQAEALAAEDLTGGAWAHAPPPPPNSPSS